MSSRDFPQLVSQGQEAELLQPAERCPPPGFLVTMLTVANHKSVDGIAFNLKVLNGGKTIFLRVGAAAFSLHLFQHGVCPTFSAVPPSLSVLHHR